MPAMATAAPPPESAELQVRLAGLRSTDGVVRLCLTQRTQQAFLKCQDDPARVTKVLPAKAATTIRIDGLKPGEYSLLLIHDENGNGKLDKMMAMPREGFGFSRNPAIRMGPPHYGDVHFRVPAGESAQTVKVRYLL
jgi:uncharacterized protein (DUF2141 family)